MRQLIPALLLIPVIAYGDAEPILMDGLFDDWTSAPIHTDAAGDGGSTGIDYGSIHLANDGAHLFIRVEVGGEITLQEQPNQILYLDTDNNPATGTSISGIGADLVWDFGDRDGNFRGTWIDWEDTGIHAAPSHAATEFEIALRRDATPAGQALFPGTTIRLILRDANSGGDRIPNSGSVAYTFDDSDPLTPATLPLVKSDPDHVRLMTYNTLQDGLWYHSTEFTRIFEAVLPDVIAFQEIYDHSIGETRSWMTSRLGGFWYYSSNGWELQLLSRYPVIDAWEAGPRGWATLLNLPEPFTHDLLVINVHLSCCSNDEGRQEQIDAIMAFIRDAMTQGGVLDLAADTPIVICGDTNMYGDLQQVVTMLTGDIDDNATYGPDFAPDWDGSQLDPLYSRQLQARLCYTWYDEGSSYSPSHIDRITYTGSALNVAGSYILHTPGIDADMLDAHDLQADDTLIASDHVPHIVDFTATVVSASDLPAPVEGLCAFPNPFNPGTTLSFDLVAPGAVRLRVFDLAGRLVDEVNTTTLPAGANQLSWQAPTGLASGSYVMEITSGRQVLRSMVAVVK